MLHNLNTRRLWTVIFVLWVFAAGCVVGCKESPSVDDMDTTGTGSNGTGGNQPLYSDTNLTNIGGQTTVYEGGFITLGTLQGTAMPIIDELGSTASATSFNAQPAGSPLCLSGTVAGDYDASVRIRIPTNQPQGADSSQGAVLLPGTGVEVNLTYTLFPPVANMILVGEGGDDDPSKQWCKSVGAPDYSFLWGDFNTDCTHPDYGTPYAGEPIEYIDFVVSGVAGTPQDYNFCLNSLNLRTDLPVVDTDTVVFTGPIEVCAKSSTRSVLSSDGTYYLAANNVWGGNANDQCITIDGTSFTVTKQSGSSSDGSTPVSYPSFIYGAKNNWEKSIDSGLPKQVSQLGKVSTHFASNATSGAGKFNASYDIWFANGANDLETTDNHPTGAYLMVWLHSAGNPVPIGWTSTSVTIAGASWQVWTGGSGPSGAPYIAYVRNGSTSSATFDVIDFINDAKSRGVIKDTMYLMNVQAGFEIWSGGQGLAVSDFWVNNI